MSRFLEVHVLQSFAPSNLNRDDTGSPKDAIFGGVRRARISSQCLKRAARMYVREHHLVDAQYQAFRTKRVVSQIVDLLESSGHRREDAERVTVGALSGLKLKVSDGKSQYLLFLGQEEIRKLAGLIGQYWNELTQLPQTETEGSARKKKSAAKGVVPAELVKSLEQALDGGKAVDLALFGRMLADLPHKNRDAACQVAHALSTHKVEREFDFYTAVDDLQPEDNAGADMLGTIEFTSACYYRYSLLDVDKLLENLQGDKDLTLKATEAYLNAMIYALPTGKQNTFAARNLPALVAVSLRTSGCPCSLANAFEQPVRAKQGGLIAPSILALAAEWNRSRKAYGPAERALYMNASESEDTGLPGTSADSAEDLIRQAVAEAREALGG